jgi:N4-gp56 family major capsid protein
MSFNTYLQSQSRLNTYAEAKALKRAMPYECLSMFGSARMLPSNSTDNITFRRVNPFPVATTLTEGTVPSSRTLTKANISVAVSEYGDLVRFSSRDYDLSPEETVKEASEACGDQIVETRENVLWNVLRAGTAVGFTNGTTRGGLNTAISVNSLDAAVRVLEGNRAKKVTKKVATDDSFNTVNVRPSFIAFCHTDLKRDIQALAGFLDAKDYSDYVHPEEFGSRGHIRFVTCPHFEAFLGAGSTTINGMKQTGANTDVYPMVIVGEEAYGHVTVRGKDGMLSGASVKVLLPNKLDSGNPLGQFGSVGWKGYFTALRLNEAWMYRIETCATAL